MRCRLGVSAVESRRAHVIRGRGAAHSPGGTAGVESAGRLLRTGRADHRFASARQCHAARYLGSSAAKGNTLVVVEHDEDTIRRADHVIDLGPGAGTRGGRLVAQGTALSWRNRGTPRPADVWRRRCCIRDPGGAPSSGTRHDRNRRREAAQSSQELDARIPRGRLAVIPAFRDPANRRWRATCCWQLKRLLSRPSRAERAQDRRGAQGCDAIHRLAVDQPRSRGRPDADRQDAALLPGDLHRILGRHSPPVRRYHRSAHARVHRQPLLFQYRGRALRGVRRPGHAADRDEFPAGRPSSVRCVRRQALQPRDLEHSIQGQEHRRDPRDERRRCAGILRGAAQRASSA